MDTLGNIFLVILWIAGIVAIFIAPELALMLWAVPAGNSTGIAIAKIVQSTRDANGTR